MMQDLAQVFDILDRAAAGTDEDRRAAVPVARDQLAAALARTAAA